uniref:Uncharacterized protein n=1 Tax=Picea glauca TaxID=3330 RepID=A0A101LTR6_PICGL|nr:hypothetical protein ABT39_MTgene3522 [Picea glauca]QHR87558.1 hypothetical protein Q903MT_gene1569 [Picea sitchensis]
MYLHLSFLFPCLCSSLYMLSPLPLPLLRPSLLMLLLLFMVLVFNYQGIERELNK